MERLRRFEQGLGGDAAAVKAGPAQLVLVDERHTEPQLGRPESGRVTARACAQDDEVEVVGGTDCHWFRWDLG
jgi:hypothetical protein